MTSNKRHHFVPQFYIRNFSEDKRRVAVFNINQRKTVLSASIKGQCQRSFLYGKDGEREKLLSQIETKAAIVIHRVIDTGCIPPKGTKEFVCLLYYLLLQHGRTIYAVEESNEMLDQFIKSTFVPSMKAKGISEKDLAKVRVTLTDPTGYNLSHMLQCYPLLIDLEFSLFRNCTRYGFITSDNPLVLYNQLLEERRYTSNTGLQSQGLQIFLPLSAGYCLFVFDPKVYGFGKRKVSTVNLQEETDIKQINSLQLVSAMNNVYFDARVNEGDALSKEWSRVKKYRRLKKMNLDILEEPREKPNQKKLLFGTYREDVRVGLKLSKVKILPNAKKRKNDLLQRVAVRNEVLYDDFKEFKKLVKQGLYKPSQFYRFTQVKYKGADT